MDKSAVYGDNSSAFEPRDGYGVEYLGKALSRHFPLFQCLW